MSGVASDQQRRIQSSVLCQYGYAQPSKTGALASLIQPSCILKWPSGPTEVTYLQGWKASVF
jgi:hypothetical protein